MPRWLNCFFLWALAPFLLSGCGGGSGLKTYPVKGTVKYKGAPLADAVVTFYPDQGRPASGTTDAQGAFFLSTIDSKDGAAAGTYRVAIAEATPDTPPMPMPGEPEPPAKPPRFPVRYTDQYQANLPAEVKAGGDNDFTFELTD